MQDLVVALDDQYSEITRGGRVDRQLEKLQLFDDYLIDALLNHFPEIG